MPSATIRVRRRRGPPVSEVVGAVRGPPSAVKADPCVRPYELAILAWHLLTHDVDYRWAPARLTADKIRAVELAAGASSRRGRVPGSGDARERATLAREMERAVLAQAEAAYVAFVEARQETDAVAATRAASVQTDPDHHQQASFPCGQCHRPRLP